MTITISHQQFEKMKSVLAVLFPSSREQQHNAVMSQLAAAGVEVEKTAEEQLAELRARDAAFEDAIRKALAGYHLAAALPGSPMSLVWEHFPKTRPGG